MTALQYTDPAANGKLYTWSTTNSKFYSNFSSTGFNFESQTYEAVSSAEL